MISIEKILRFAIQDETSFVLFRDGITNDLCVSNTYYLQIAKFYDQFYSDYGKLPKKGDIKVWLSKFDDNQRSAVKSALKSIIDQDVEEYTTEYMVDEGIQYLKDRATKNAVKRMDASESLNPSTLEHMLEQINKISAKKLENIVDLRDVDQWIKPQEELEVYWTSGIQKLDSLIGGFGPELGFIVAPPGIGKTTTLINFATEAANQGAQVLHLTFELYDTRTAHRYYRRIAQSPKAEFYGDALKEIKDHTKHWFSFAEGNVHILYYPAYELTVDDVKNVVRQYVEEYGRVDYIVLDYLDLLSGGKKYAFNDDWDRLGKMTHEIRGLCPEYDCTILSATQANREAFDKESFSGKHIAGSIGKMQAADLVFGLMQTEDELQVNQGRIKILKVREGGGRNQEIPIYINMDRMFIADLDHPDVQSIIREEAQEMNNVGKQLYAGSEPATG